MIGQKRDAHERLIALWWASRFCQIINFYIGGYCGSSGLASI